MIDNSQICYNADGNRCAFNGVYQPKFPVRFENTNSKFYGLGAYKYVWEFFGLSSTDDLDTLHDSASIVCNKNWDDLVIYGNEKGVSEDYLLNYCYQAAYSISLLHKGMKLTMMDTPIIIEDSIGG